MEEAGGQCLPCEVDIREESQVKAAVDKAVEKFGGIDILVNNASAISLTGTVDTTMKKYALFYIKFWWSTFTLSYQYLFAELATLYTSTLCSEDLITWSVYVCCVCIQVWSDDERKHSWNLPNVSFPIIMH